MRRAESLVATGARRSLGAVLAAGALVLAACGEDPAPMQEHVAPSAQAEPGKPVRAQGEPEVSTVASGLEAPWEIAFLPDRRALVTERPGRVRLLDANGRLRREPLATVDVAAFGEGGLLGVAVDPDFRRNRFVYLYRTTDSGNEVARYRLDGDRLVEERTIVTGIEGAGIHNGGRIRVGPDDRLYIGTGDAADPGTAQDSGSLNGKLLRLDPEAYRGEGGRPEIVSSGHRNPQGFDWQPGTEQLVSDEHGPSGNDEVNVIEQGSNYGWPEGQGDEHGRFTAPAALYEETIAPSGASFVTMRGSAWTGDYLVASLAGEQIRRVRFDGSSVEENEPLFEGTYGRLRTIVEGPDGALYALTNNTDGRGTPRDGDDRVLRIVPPAR